MTDGGVEGAAEPGSRHHDLPDLTRELFLQCVDQRTQLLTPAPTSTPFIEELWRQVSAAFGLVRREWLQGAPQPWPALLDEQRGVAEAVLEGRLDAGELPT